MSYTIHITRTAEQDLLNAANYIEYVLKNPKAADDLLVEAENRISSLIYFPEKYQLADDPILASWGLRFISVNNYLSFYTVDNEKKRVIIVRFLYQKSNWRAILHGGISLI